MWSASEGSMAKMRDAGGLKPLLPSGSDGSTGRERGGRRRGKRSRGRRVCPQAANTQEVENNIRGALSILGVVHHNPSSWLGFPPPQPVRLCSQTQGAPNWSCHDTGTVSGLLCGKLHSRASPGGARTSALACRMPT